MINNIVNFTQIPDVASLKPTPAVPAEIAAASGSEKTKNQTDNSNLSQGNNSPPQPSYTLRLTVDKDPNTGEWVYKAIDSYTGKVVSQMPRQALLELRKSSSYTAGSVIKTEV